AFLSVLPAVSKAMKAVEALQHGAGGKGGEGDLVLPIPPVFSRALGRAAAMLRQKPAWALNQSEIIELFRQVTRVHPAGMIHYFLGTQLAVAERFAEAEEAFLEATVQPSFVPVRRPALLGLSFTQWQLADNPRGTGALSQWVHRVVWMRRSVESA